MKAISQLEQLKKLTRVAADTADFESMRACKAREGMTNPSLVLAAAQKVEYAALLDHAVTDLENSTLSRSAKVDAVMDNLMVNFGLEILKIVPGRISTEVTYAFPSIVKDPSTRGGISSAFTKSKACRANAC